jgi:hypothetical protein
MSGKHQKMEFKVRQAPGDVAFSPKSSKPQEMMLRPIQGPQEMMLHTFQNQASRVCKSHASTAD